MAIPTKGGLFPRNRGGTGTGLTAGTPGILPTEAPVPIPPSSTPTGAYPSGPITEPGFGPRSHDSLEAYRSGRLNNMSRIHQGRMPLRGGILPSGETPPF